MCGLSGLCTPGLTRENPTMSNDFVAWCRELLSPLGTVRSRRMFGGHGFYVDDLFLALIFDERLYLKVDDETRASFEAQGCTPFTYSVRDGGQHSLSYFTAPDDAMDSPAQMLPWARLALASALRARASKPPARKRAPAATPRPVSSRKRAKGKAG
ncbi:hypothetical protein GCM10009107_40210 [Ideonella azotifigens]|uniref:TfoX N-terminal domain-containing protein n=2 Tax=Ideonella azotifigens TaxID=513160 RepID=A0ABP3VLP1_9BURK